MMTIDECVNVLRTNSAQRPDLPATEYEGATVHASSIAHDTATAEECDTVAFGHCPPDLKEFWRLTRSAKLFEDVTTKWWGLEILSPDEAARETAEYHSVRARDALKGDLIVDAFSATHNCCSFAVTKMLTTLAVSSWSALLIAEWIGISWRTACKSS